MESPLIPNKSRKSKTAKEKTDALADEYPHESQLSAGGVKPPAAVTLTDGNSSCAGGKRRGEEGALIILTVREP